MNRKMKSVGMWLLLGSLSTGMAYADLSKNESEIDIVQQSGICQGIVKDATGESVIGASVIVKGTTNGTTTDIDGNFSLSNVKKGDVIEISFVGYITQTIKWDGTPINIILKEDTQTLEEVVVTGYGGSQKRAALTTAISKMDDQVLKNAAMSNAGQALQGSVTGLRVINTTGQPGAEPDITLRGGATITGGNSKALIVVDGIIRESMSDINPSDIESIQVLKDAASTAIYGARANGGVILVETKSGKAGKASVNYKFKLGVNFARYGYDFCNAHDYLYYNRLGYKRYTNNVPGAASVDTQTGYGTQNDLIDVKYLTDENSHLRNEGWLVMDDPYYEGKQLLYKDYSGQLDDAVFANTALTQDHYVNITGGNDKGTYMASMGYYNEDGQIKGTGYKRFNGSVSGTYKIFPFLNVKAGATYTWSQQPSLWIGSYELFYRTRSQRPTWNPYNEDGSPASGWGTGDGNPEYYRDKLTSEDGTRKSTYNFGFDLDIIPKKLTFSGNSSLYHYDYQYETFNKSYQTQTSSTPNNTRDASAKIERYTQIQVNGTLNYKDTFKDKHNLDVMVGSEYFGYNEFMMEAKTQNSPTDDIPTLNAGATRTSTTSQKTGYRIASVFGRINYNYQMKYLLSLVARYDGISRLKDNRWGFFPGVSVGWNVTEEDFWKESKISEVISNIKPRLSYGRNEYSLWNDQYRMNMVMNQQFFSSYCDENGTPLSNSEIADINGLIRYQIEQDLYTQLYREGDSRKANSLKGIYNKENEQITFKAPIAYKFQGVLLDGDATRSWLDDYPIYRYADCLLALATAKAFLGEDISAEINEVRERAYGTEYFNEHRNEIAYPNDKDASFYANNRFVGSDDNPIETILKERMREFLFEGKRWYDIRLMGDDYATKYSDANSSRLLWPIDENTLGENSALEQTPGY